MLHMLAHTTRSAVATLVVAMLLPALLHAETSQAPDGLLPVEALSPGFLGMYRKVMEVEDDISKYADKYDVDLTLARALCIQESGGNANLNSWAGAKGYFQVMPSTFRTLKVKTNIEAGIKYLSQMIRRFDREGLRGWRIQRWAGAGRPRPSFARNPAVHPVRRPVPQRPEAARAVGPASRVPNAA